MDMPRLPPEAQKKLTEAEDIIWTLLEAQDKNLDDLRKSYEGVARDWLQSMVKFADMYYPNKD